MLAFSYGRENEAVSNRYMSGAEGNAENTLEAGRGFSAVQGA
jgi:hypothetical protein